MLPQLLLFPELLSICYTPTPDFLSYLFEKEGRKVSIPRLAFGLSAHLAEILAKIEVAHTPMAGIAQETRGVSPVCRPDK